MKKALLSIAVLAVVALAAVFQMQPVRADSNHVSPGKPSNVSVELQGERTLYVSWDASPRERSILYEIFYRRSGAATWTPVAVGYEGNTGVSYSTRDPIVVPTLGKYQVRVKACNHYGGANILCNNSAAATVQVGAVPAKPTGLKLTQPLPLNHDINVTWEAVEGADNYKIRWRAEDASLGDPIFATTTQATIPLDEYGDWIVRVEACNDAGCGKPVAKTITTKILPPKQSGFTVETQMNSLFLNLAWHNHGDHQYFIMLRKPDKGYLGVRGSSRGGSTFRIKVGGYGDWFVGLQSCWPGISWWDVCRHFPIAEKRVSVEGTTPARMSNFEVKDVSSRHSAVAASWDEDPHATHYEVKWIKWGKEFKPEHAANVPAGTNSFKTALPSGQAWTVQARACNVNLCGPAVSETLSVTIVVQVPQFDEIQNLWVAVKHATLYGNASWDKVPGATYYKVWFADTATSGMTPHIYTSSHIDFYVPGHGIWDFVVQACNDDGCFAHAYKRLEVYPPKE